MGESFVLHRQNVDNYQDFTWWKGLNYIEENESISMFIPHIQC